jgi:predicted ATPase/class 3 adenylate cyclase
MDSDPGETVPDLPQGRVTFVFTDVVGSTSTFLAHGDRYLTALRALHARQAEAAEAQGGRVVEIEGDGAMLAFGSAAAAVSAVEPLLRALEAEWDQAVGVEPRLRLRAGGHVGHAIPEQGRYLALPVYVAARIAATANAGQLVVSSDVVADIGGPEELPPTSDVVGVFRLKDIPEPVTLWRLSGDKAPLRANPELRTNVARARTSFVGRADELTELRTCLNDPASRLVSVIGTGGMGKTRLVSQLALSEADSWEGGVWLAELATYTPETGSVPAVAAALGVSDAEPVALIAELSRRGRSLLILDNCEHMLDSAAETAQWLLDGCPDVTVITTSREALGIPEERVWRIPPIGLDADAVQLFADRARLPHDSAVVAEICQALEGVPLAIELAAAAAGSAPLDQLTGILATDALSRRGGPERHRSLRATLDWSLGLLSDTERNLLLSLSLFPGRFDAVMANQMAGAVAEEAGPAALARLVRGSLVDLDGSEYRLLSTVAIVAREQLQGHPELRDRAESALMLWAKEFSAQRWAVIHSSHGDVPHGQLLAVLSAVEASVRHHQPQMGKAWNLLRVIHSSLPGISVSSHARRAVLATSPIDEDTLLAKVCAFWLESDRGEPDDRSRIEADLLARLDACHACPRVRVITLLAVSGSRIDWDAGRGSEDLLDEALRLTSDDPGLEAYYGWVCSAIAWRKSALGDLHGAAEAYRQALNQRDPYVVAGNLAALAEIETLLGEHGPALQHVDQAIELGLAGYALILVRAVRAAALLGSGRQAEAAAEASEARAMFRAEPHPAAWLSKPIDRLGEIGL